MVGRRFLFHGSQVRELAPDIDCAVRRRLLYVGQHLGQQSTVMVDRGVVPNRHGTLITVWLNWMSRSVGTRTRLYMTLYDRLETTGIGLVFSVVEPAINMRVWRGERVRACRDGDIFAVEFVVDTVSNLTANLVPRLVKFIGKVDRRAVVPLTVEW